MIVKFFKRGDDPKTRAGECVKDYLMNSKRVANGTAKLLRGDPDLTTQIINSLSFASTYTSGVLAFDKSDNPTAQQQQQIMDDFEQALLPNFDKSRYQCYWVRHTDKGNIELNFVIAKTDLATGKYLNPYHHSSDLQRIELFKQITNLKYGFKEPNEHRRAIAPIAQSPKAIVNKSRGDWVEALTDVIEQSIINGDIQNRADIVKTLNSIADDDYSFKVTKQSKAKKTAVFEQGKGYITVEITDKTTKASHKIRLKGAYYESRFTVSQETINTINQRHGYSVASINTDDRASTELSKDTKHRADRLSELEREYQQQSNKRERWLTERFKPVARAFNELGADKQRSQSRDDSHHKNIDGSQRRIFADSNSNSGDEADNKNTGNPSIRQDGTRDIKSSEVALLTVANTDDSRSQDFYRQLDRVLQSDSTEWFKAVLGRQTTNNNGFSNTINAGLSWLNNSYRTQYNSNGKSAYILASARGDGGNQLLLTCTKELKTEIYYQEKGQINERTSDTTAVDNLATTRDVRQNQQTGRTLQTTARATNQRPTNDIQPTTQRANNRASEPVQSSDDWATKLTEQVTRAVATVAEFQLYASDSRTKANESNATELARRIRQLSDRIRQFKERIPIFAKIFTNNEAVTALADGICRSRADNSEVIASIDNIDNNKQQLDSTEQFINDTKQRIDDTKRFIDETNQRIEQVKAQLKVKNEQEKQAQTQKKAEPQKRRDDDFDFGM